jgi:hypothetical protein
MSDPQVHSPLTDFDRAARCAAKQSDHVVGLGRVDQEDLDVADVRDDRAGSGDASSSRTSAEIRHHLSASLLSSCQL